MPNQPNQFDPMDQFAELMTEIDATMQKVSADLDRLNWLRKKIAERYAAIEAAADALDVYPESEAAAKLKTNERLLADQRRRFDLPHFKMGRDVFYTSDHLREIVEILASGKRRRALQAMPLKSAA